MNKTVTEYKIVYANDMMLKDGNALAKAVARAMTEGWQPIGGPAVEGTLMYQAMVKYA